MKTAQSSGEVTCVTCASAFVIKKGRNKQGTKLFVLGQKMLFDLSDRCPVDPGTKGGGRTPPPPAGAPPLIGEA